MALAYVFGAGDSVRVTFRLNYNGGEVARLPNNRSYSHLALFLHGETESEYWPSGATNWARRPVRTDGISLDWTKRPVTADNQEMSVNISTVATYGIRDNVPGAVGELDQFMKVRLYAAYVGAAESAAFPGPAQRTWHLATLSIQRRRPVAILLGRDSPSAGRVSQFFTNAQAVLGRWMHIETIDNLREAIEWLVNNHRGSLPPFGVVHFVGHCDGHVWLVKRWANIPDAAPRLGWYELEPTHIRSLANELRTTNVSLARPSGNMPGMETVGAGSEVVVHSCNFARDNTDLLAAVQELFVARPATHGPNVFVGFGRPDDRPAITTSVEFAERELPGGTYQTLEVNPDPRTSTHFSHV